MSRIGKKPVSVPAGVKITLDPRSRGIGIEGPKGKLSFTYRPEVTVTWDESEKRIVCSIPQEQVRIGQIRAYWGTTRAIIQNMVVGVTEGFSKRLEVVGVGWGAKAHLTASRSSTPSTGSRRPGGGCTAACAIYPAPSTGWASPSSPRATVSRATASAAKKKSPARLSPR